MRLALPQHQEDCHGAQPNDRAQGKETGIAIVWAIHINVEHDFLTQEHQKLVEERRKIVEAENTAAWLANQPTSRTNELRIALTSATQK